MSSMSKLWTTLGLSLLMHVFTMPFLQQRLFRYWLTRNPPTAESTATGTATTKCSGDRKTPSKAFNTKQWILLHTSLNVWHVRKSGDIKWQQGLLNPRWLTLSHWWNWPLQNWAFILERKLKRWTCNLSDTREIGHFTKGTIRIESVLLASHD